MPMSAELPITMLACARLGVIHSQVFGGFSGRPAPTGSSTPAAVLITMDAYYRGGTLLDHKKKPTSACDLRPKTARVDKVLVWQRYPGKYSAPDPHGRRPGFFVNDLLKDYYGARVEPER
jgi:acetyl-CoA synthetase